MANLDRPNGFTIESPEKYTPNRYLVNNAETFLDREIVYMNSDGEASRTRSEYMIGIMTGTMINGYTGAVVTTASATRGDYIMVYDDPHAVFVGQTTDYQIVDPYTQATAATMVDFILTTLIQEIDSGATSENEVQVLGPAANPETGDLSAVGSNALVRFRLNPAKHVFGIGK